MRIHQVITAIHDRLEYANGRRRVRRCDLGDVAQAIAEAIEHQIGWVRGGTVANGYAYPASTTTVLAAHRPQHDDIVIMIGEADAHRDASPVTWAGVRSVRPRHLAEWRARLDAALPEDAIRLTRAEAETIVQLVRRRAVWQNILLARRARVSPATLVTRADSLAAGNCPRETDRVAGWFAGRAAVPADELLSAVQQRAPHLVPYALRAIQRAEARQAAEVAG